MSVSNSLIYYIITFLICWYPFFIIVATIELLIYKFFYKIRYREELNIHTVEFVHRGRRKRTSYDISNESYKFIFDNKGRVKRYRSKEEKLNRRYKVLVITIFYIVIIFVFGAISTINFGYSASSYIKSAIYVSFTYIIMWTSLWLIYIPMEYLAKDYIKRNIVSYDNK